MENIQVSHLGIIKMNIIAIEGMLMHDEPNLEIIKDCAQEILSACAVQEDKNIEEKEINYKKSLMHNQKLYKRLAESKKKQIIDTINLLIDLLKRLLSIKTINYGYIIEIAKKINYICINNINCNLLLVNNEIEELKLTMNLK